MLWYWIVAIVLGALLALAVLSLWIISFLVAKFVYSPKRYSRQDQREFNHKCGWDAGVEVFKSNKPLEFLMSDGYVIHGDYDIVPWSDKFCILAHGHQTTREGARRYALIFKELGYSTIVYDERGHGDNVRVKASMGKNESRDLAEIIEQVYSKFGRAIHFGLQGVSMGAATVLLSTQYTQKEDFIVSDCAYSSFKEAVRSLLKARHLPSWPLIGWIGLELKKHGGFSYEEVDPLKAVSNLKVPVLFIHGDADRYVRPDNATRLFDATSFEKLLIFFKGAGHASSITADREKYKDEVSKFLKELESENE